MRGIYIGLGSNLGDKAAHLAFARQQFNVVAESPIYASPAMLLDDAPPSWNKTFFNQVIEIDSSLKPKELLAELKRIEAAAGRHERGRWAPRELDLDIIAYGDVVMDTPELTLPHMGYTSRDFVLLPLRDIASEWPDIDRMIERLPEITATIWHKMTELVGILNITPDSFSDGGAIDVATIVARFEKLVREGADIIDIGAESTRPNATPLSHTEEWNRLKAPLAAIVNHKLRPKILLSIDTRYAKTAEQALGVGADWINDVSGLSDTAMIRVLKDALCDVVVMHSLSIPADKNVTLPSDCDPVAEILNWKKTVLKKGIPEHRLIFDPGLGFGKTPEQSRMLVGRADELIRSGGRWLIGHSRKSFLGGSVEERDAPTLALSKRLAAQGVDFLRVHDVAGHESL